MTTANNVTRLLDARKIPYQAFEMSTEKRGALDTARILGVPPETVYKTIVVQRERGKPILAVIPGPNEVDLKRLAAVVGEKKVHVPTQHEAEQLTGLQVGGISPLALINKGFAVWIDEVARAQEHIHVSGGQRGLNVRLAPADLAQLVNARFALISGPAQDSAES